MPSDHSDPSPPPQSESQTPRKHRWLPRSRSLRIIVYVGIAFLALNAAGFAILLYFGTRPNLPYVDYYPEFRQLSIDAHARHGIAPSQPGQPDAWVILEGIQSRAKKTIEPWEAAEENRRAAANPPDFDRLDLYKMCKAVLRSPAPAAEHPDAASLRDLIACLDDAGVWKFTRMLPTAAAALPTKDALDFNAETVERSPIVSAALLLCVRARLEAETGNCTAMLDSLTEADAIADRFASQPDVFTRQTSDWVREGIDDAAISLASRRALTPEALRGLAELLAQHRESNYATALRAGRLRALHTLQSVYYGHTLARPTITVSPTATGAPQKQEPSLILGLLFRTLSSHKDNAEALIRCCEVFEQADTMPFSEALKLDARVRKISDEIPARLLTAKAALPHPPIAVLTPRASAWHAAASTAVAIERYRLEHNTLPRSLDDLVPAFLPQPPKDPFSPSYTLRYTVSDIAVIPGYTLYSVGYDQTDNHGMRANDPFKAMYDAGTGTDYLFVTNQSSLTPPPPAPAQPDPATP